jgi:hypothetical protein
MEMIEHHLTSGMAKVRALLEVVIADLS